LPSSNGGKDPFTPLPGGPAHRDHPEKYAPEPPGRLKIAIMEVALRGG